MGNIRQTAAKQLENEESRKKNGTDRRSRGRTAARGWAHDRASHHGQPVVATGLPGLVGFSKDAFCACLGASFWAAVLPMLGHFGPHLLSSLIIQAS